MKLLASQHESKRKYTAGLVEQPLEPFRAVDLAKYKLVLETTMIKEATTSRSYL